MAVICFASLKGGVGKTSLSVNVSHAFAERGCETLLIDLDPAGHTTRFFKSGDLVHQFPQESPLARLFLANDSEFWESERKGIIETAYGNGLSLFTPVRERFSVLPSGPELRHFLWGRGGRMFRQLFPRLIEELKDCFDQVVIDTPPDLNPTTRNSIASADLVAVPVDASEMSIYCLEEIISQTAHIQGPAWSIIRTMVNRQAHRGRALTNERLGKHLDLEGTENKDIDLEDPGQFISLLRARTVKAAESANVQADARPIYLLNTVVYRTDEQNKLSFYRKTAFDSRNTARLAEQYADVAGEVEDILASVMEQPGNPHCSTENLLRTQAGAF